MNAVGRFELCLIEVRFNWLESTEQRWLR